MSVKSNLSYPGKNKMENTRTAEAAVISDICYAYGKKDVLKSASFTCFPGSCAGILGSNGSGKSTLLSILAGIRRPQRGSFFCYGRDMFKDPASVSRFVGYVPQTNPLMEDLTVADNIRLWKGSAFDPAHPILERLELKDLLGERTGRLSGGMKRRAAIACALIGDPPVLLMDEPTTSLDLHHKEIIHGYMKDYRERNGTIIVSTHDTTEMAFCSDLYYLKNGTLIKKDFDTAVQDLKEDRS